MHKHSGKKVVRACFAHLPCGRRLKEGKEVKGSGLRLDVVWLVISQNSKNDIGEFTGYMTYDIHIRFSFITLFLVKGFEIRIVLNGNGRSLP